jgi:hypothetical protein
MTILNYNNSPKFRLVLLALFTVITLSLPSGAKAAERDGTVLFFSFEDIQQVLTNPSLPSLTSLLSPSQPTSSFAWRAQSETVEQDHSLGWNTSYGNGLWADGYRLPGPRPLWGY